MKTSIKKLKNRIARELLKHETRIGMKVYAYVLTERRWGHDINEFMYALKHSQKNNYSLAILSCNQRNTLRLKRLCYKGLQPIFIDLSNIDEFYIEDYIRKKKMET